MARWAILSDVNLEALVAVLADAARARRAAREGDLTTGCDDQTMSQARAATVRCGVRGKSKRTDLD